MSFDQLAQHVLDDTLVRSLPAFRPEAVLCLTIVALLVARMVAPRRGMLATAVALVGAAAALCFALEDGSRAWHDATSLGGPPSESLFTGLLVLDSLSIAARQILLGFLVLFVVLGRVTGVPPRDDATELHVLVFGSMVGMCLATAANHMVVVMLAVEMAGVPGYVLAAISRHRRDSAEAALKYAVFGGCCAALMLYGISLLVGVLGSAYLPTMAERLHAILAGDSTGPRAMVLALGGVMLAVGLAFKLSAVPFHFWAPDVFEGAPAEIGAWFSVAGKAAALVLVARLAVVFSFPPGGAGAAIALTESAPAPAESLVPGAATVRSAGAAPRQPSGADSSAEPSAGEAASIPGHAPAAAFIGVLIAAMAAATCTFGNLAAYGQTNLKRLLAYSTIAHAGYMLMPIAAAAGASGFVSNPAGPADARFAVATLVGYLVLYVPMNLGAFTVVALVRNATGGEGIDDCRGLMRRRPALAVCMTVVLFSLVGIPPLGGFLAKFGIFAALARSGWYALLAVGGLNTVLSLFYYLRVVRAMVAEPSAGSNAKPATTTPSSAAGTLYCVAVTLPLVVVIVWAWSWFAWAEAAAASLAR